MKKIIFPALALALTLLLAGCGSQRAEPDGSTIHLSNKGSSGPSGVTVSGNTITVHKGGTLRVTGSLSEGQLVVDAEDKAVTLILDGAEISNSSAAAILAENVKSLTIELAENSQNSLTSGTPTEITSSTADSDASGGAVQAKANLTITGKGSLTVGGYLNNGISTSKTLSIEDGDLEIFSVHHGLRGKDKLVTLGGNVTVTAAGDGLHSNDSIEMKGGSYTISVFDDAIHADNSLTVEDGNITILQSEEGLEADHVTLNGGTLSVTASDDGINAGGTDSVLIINGGLISVNANGDGLDSNKDLIINGGTLLVNGPTANNNTALDAGGENGGKLVVNGGTVLALGSSGMASPFDGSSTQCSFLYAGQQLVPGSELVITDSRGEELLRHEVTKNADCVIFSSAALVQGESVTLSLNGSDTEIVLEEISTSVGGGMNRFGGKGGFGGRDDPMREDFSQGERPPMGMDGQEPPEGERPRRPEGGEAPDFPERGFPEGGFPEGEKPPENERIMYK